MKKLLFSITVLFVISITCHAQIELFSNGGISIGDLVNPGSEMTKFHDPVTFTDPVTFSAAETNFSSHLLPTSTGKNLGNSTHKWNNLVLAGYATIDGNVTIDGNTTVDGTALFASSVTFQNGFSAGGSSCVFSSLADINSGLNAEGNIYFHDNPYASGSVTFGGSVTYYPIKSGSQVYFNGVPVTVSGSLLTQGTLTIQGTFNNYSDSTLKENIELLPKNSLKRLLNLQGVSYEFKNDINNTRISGFVAQDLQREFPELVVEEKEGLAIKSLEFLPYLVEAIKEQNVVIEELRSRVVELEQASESVSYLKNLSTNAEDDIASSGPMLYQNHPNPFTEKTIISYNTPDNTRNAMICIYDLQGSQIKCLQINSGGTGEKIIYGSVLEPGLYIYALLVDGSFVDSKQMILTD